MAAISRRHSQNAFSGMKMYEFRLKNVLKFVRKGPTDIPAVVQTMAWCRLDDKPLSELMVVRLPTHLCITRP